jgi:hypothetical protein
VAWGTVDADKFSIADGTLRTVNSSADAIRGFCAKCGSSLTYRRISRPGEIDFTLASLDDPTSYAPRTHIWVKDKLPRVQLNDGLPQFETVAS